jgi:hypothetical protein
MNDLTAIVSIYIPSNSQLIEIDPLWTNLEEIIRHYSFLQIGYDEYVATVDIPTLIAIDNTYRQREDDVSIHDTMTIKGVKFLADIANASIQIVTCYHAEIIKNAPRYL